MKYRVPKDCAGVVHDGAAIQAAPDGSLEAAEASAPALLAHGIVPWMENRRADPPAGAGEPRRTLRRNPASRAS